MSVVLKPPALLMFSPGTKTVFLAGSIEQGAATDWQDVITRQLDRPGLVLLNPRRDQWDPSWRQDISNPHFREQVTWELDAQDRADVILMYFDPDTKSPITLLELGLYARSGRLLVGCPSGFWRRGNVQVVCDRYEIPLVDTLEQLVALVLDRMG